MVHKRSSEAADFKAPNRQASSMLEGLGFRV